MMLRFAPSPTGLLHVGNTRTLLINWLFARKHGATFVVRLDDTDIQRSKVEYADQIFKDLAWLGLDYDQTFRQMDRLDRYKEVAQTLMDQGHLYPCYETPQELEFKRKRSLSQGRPPRYDRAALNLTPQDHAAFEKEGRKAHWRFKLQGGEVSWDDLAHGIISFNDETLSDPILIREDGSPVYTFCSVVDDLDTKVTHIFRGNDHITNTSVQIQLMKALGGDVSQVHFAHFPLLTGAGGEELSKRIGSLSLKSLQEDGVEPMAVNGYLSRLGTCDDITPAGHLQSLVDSFDIKKFGKGSPKFSTEDLLRLNSKLLHHTPYGCVERRLRELDPSIDESFWNMVRPNLNRLDDVLPLKKMIDGPITPIRHHEEYLQEAIKALPEDPWDEHTWTQWTQILKEKTGRKGKDLFMPLRQALTGQDHGPEMKMILCSIGREKTLARLEGKYV
jgi:glutamyl-tRNA synthetase